MSFVWVEITDFIDVNDEDEGLELVPVPILNSRPMGFPNPECICITSFKTNPLGLFAPIPPSKYLDSFIVIGLKYKGVAEVARATSQIAHCGAHL